MLLGNSTRIGFYFTSKYDDDDNILLDYCSYRIMLSRFIYLHVVELRMYSAFIKNVANLKDQPLLWKSHMKKI